MVTAEGYEPWESTVFMLGKGYGQTVLARLKKELQVSSEEGI
jgi:hypothetical protein